MCITTRKWIDTSSIFPSYVDLDGDEVFLPDSDINPLHHIKELDKDYSEKLELLRATDKPTNQVFNVIDNTGKVDMEYLKKVSSTSKENDEVANIRSIAESLDHLTILNGKKIYDRNYQQILKDRTINIDVEDIERLRNIIRLSNEINNTKYETLASLRTHEQIQNEMIETKNNNKIDFS